MPERFDPKRWRYPAAHGMIVLGVIFVAETMVMVVLPWILPAAPSRYLEATVDALLLTTIVSPVLWWVIVRPLREANHVRAEYLSHLFRSIEADRREIAHDLHDGVGQSITLLISGLRSLEDVVLGPGQAQRCKELSQLARQSLKDVKRLALGLRPSMLDDLGLAPALERIVAEVQENCPIRIELDDAQIAQTRLPENIETTLFRIVQEALTNIVRHSKARTAKIEIAMRHRQIIAIVADDGIGISRSQLRSHNPGHLGLTGMRERATLLGGDLTIESPSGTGTRLTVTLPLPEAGP